jgi:hypothetical protein
MALSIKDVHDRIIFLLDKNSAEHKSHEEIDLVLDMAQMDVFIDFLGNPKTYQPGRPVPIIAFGENQYINSALNKFRTTYTFNNGNTPGGVLTLPADCITPLALKTDVWSAAQNRNITRKVVPVNEEELIERLEDQLNPVTLYDPIALYNVNGQMQLFPEQPQSGKLYYLRRPRKPLYSYTMTGRVETLQVGSLDLEWSDNIIGDIIAKALKYFSVNMSSAELYQFSEARDKEGS